MAAQLGEEEKKAIVRHLILSTPDGELVNTVEDLKHLVADEAFMERFLDGFLVEYHMEHLSECDLGDRKIVLSRHNHKGNLEFTDYCTRQVVTIDPVTAQVRSTDSLSEEDALPAEVEATRAELQSAVDDYVTRKHHQGGAGSVHASPSGDAFYVCLSSSKQDFHNLYTAKWRSLWTVQQDGSVSGLMKAQSHYFENGNVQLNAKQEAETSLPSLNGTNLVEFIDSEEFRFQDMINSEVGDELHETFKSLKRKLTVQGQKFNFETLGHRMVGGPLGGAS